MLLKPLEETHSDTHTHTHTHTQIKIQGISIAQDGTVMQVAAMTWAGGYDHTRAHKHTSCHPNSQTVHQNDPRPCHDFSLSVCAQVTGVITCHHRKHASLHLLWAQEPLQVAGTMGSQMRTKWRSQGQYESAFPPTQGSKRLQFGRNLRERCSWISKHLSCCRLISTLAYLFLRLCRGEVKIQICISKYALHRNYPSPSPSCSHNSFRSIFNKFFRASQERTYSLWTLTAVYFHKLDSTDVQVWLLRI